MIKTHPLQHYYYEISEERIGKIPAEPRDHARLLVYDTKADVIHHDYFYHLADYLPSDAIMVMNNTGVIPARMVFTKDTGGKVEGLFLYNEGIQSDGTIPIIVMKKIVVGRKLFVGDYAFTIHRQDEQYFFIKPEFNVDELASILIRYGTTPTPRYLGKLNMGEGELRDRYQTIFAEEKKSVAAPTASLHFTARVFESLKKKGIEKTDVTLHVGMGTFADISQQNLDSKTLHTEPISISATARNTLRHAKQSHKKVIAVGTTAIRTIESQSNEILDDSGEGAIQTTTNIFITPGFEFKIADVLITNFHVPKSSLMALVDAFLRHKKSKQTILDLYKIALEHDYRFYSFGDSMLII
jgi:S-adenosylmethionine:tRNA ribosyltransferase-isomerase